MYIHFYLSQGLAWSIIELGRKVCEGLESLVLMVTLLGVQMAGFRDNGASEWIVVGPIRRNREFKLAHLSVHKCFCMLLRGWQKKHEVEKKIILGILYPLLPKLKNFFCFR